jgi:hypothetical protein
MKQLVFGAAAVVAFYFYILPAVTLLNIRKTRQPLNDTTRFLLQALFPGVDLGTVDVVADATLPWPKARRAITLGSKVYVRNGFNQRLTRDLRLMLHELVHVDQYRRLGMPGFIWAYGKALGKGGSYRKNLLEIEAFAFAMEHRGVVSHL